MTGRRFRLGERGRVPFALVGVVLLLASGLFAASVAPARETADPAVDVAVERTVADAREAFRTAVAEAGVAAAAAPPLSRANTTWSRVVNRSGPFRDYLRIRVYLAARERFRSVARGRRGVVGNASLAPTPTPAALREAKRRVTVARAGPDGTKLRATVTNVSVTATRGDRVVGRKRPTLSVVVPSPVLAVHDRVETFEGRLNAGLLKPGFGQRFTARLYGVAWARGYAQYAGAEIANVVANRHVELMANGAVLDVQRSTFGRSDPDGRDDFRRAIGSVAMQDLSAATGGVSPGGAKFLEQRFRLASRPSRSDGIPQFSAPAESAANGSVPAANASVEISVGTSADSAFAALVLDGASTSVGEGDTLNETIQSVYSATVRVVAARRNLTGGSVTPAPPAGATVVDQTDTETSVVAVSPADSGPSVRVPDGFHRLRTYDRTVRLRHSRTFVVENATAGSNAPDGDRANATERVTVNTTERRRVRVALVGDHANTPYAPDRPVRPVHERGGPFDGPNLANLTDRTEETVLAELGGPDAVAGAVARGEFDAAAESRDTTGWSTDGGSGHFEDLTDGENPFPTVEGPWPGAVREWIYRDLVGLRERVRNVSVSMPRGAVGTYQASPARELADRLRANRSQYLDLPASYGGVAGRARVAARGRFLDAVVARLEWRAESRSRRKGDLEERLSDESAPASLATVRNAYAASRRNDSGTLRDEGLDLRVDGAPPYLTTMALDSGDLASVEGNTTTYPLVARNVNYATIPYANVVDSLLTEILGGSEDPKTKLATAAQALRAANRTASEVGGPATPSVENRSALREAVQDAIYGRGGVAITLAHLLGEYGVADPLRRVGEVLERWETVDARALAVTNGSVVDPLVSVAASHAGGALDDPAARDELRVALRTTLHETLRSEGSKVKAHAAEAVATELKEAVGNRTRRAAIRQVDENFEKSISRVPAGIPVLPSPGLWYATVGVWSVTVRGEYHRFAVEARRHAPDADDPSLSYVRDGENVTVDADDDGQGELFGVADRVSFSSSTAVVVVVPAGGAGVGDIDGQMVEKSKGWPCAGPEGERPTVPNSRNATARARERRAGPLSQTCRR